MGVTEVLSLVTFVGILLQVGAEREDHLLQILLELRAILPVLGLRVVRAEFDDDHVGIEIDQGFSDPRGYADAR